VTDLERVEAIVKAVLYEGYMLYPYRPSSVKNHQRWTFGGIYPRDCATEDRSLRATMQTECLLKGGPDARLDIRVRFLHLLKREVGQFDRLHAKVPTDHEPPFTKVASLEIGEKRFHAWEEATERSVEIPSVTLGQLADGPLTKRFIFAGQRTLEPLYGAGGLARGVLVRTSASIEGEITLTAHPVASGVSRITVRIDNLTPVEQPRELGRDGPQLHAFASTHTILCVQDGAFISLLDPPDALAEAARTCDNQGTWPVMAGEEGVTNIVLSSPIILYDYPEIAPESPGDLFDATEIDEILTLRILAMTDDEKRDMASVDERARALLQRTEALTADEMGRLHGTLRVPRPESPAAREIPEDPWSAIDHKPQLAFLRVHGTDLKVGDRVRLRPRGGADIMDMVLKDEVAVIEAIERDFEDKVHLAVVLENDPGREFGLDRMPGHRFFFSPDEIETLAEERGA